MIDKNAFGLKDAGFKVVESSEAGMLSQVDRASAAAPTWCSWAGNRTR
jgi:ABC-type proline/glycine betaine transport system substrate-binding protein